MSRAFSVPGVANELSLAVETIVTLSFKKVAASIILLAPLWPWV
jgi:hypothetical protein